MNGNLYSCKAIKYFVSDNKFSSTVLLLEAAVNRCSMYCLFTEIFENSQAPESELLFSKTTCKIYKITCFYLIIISSLHEYLHVNFHITSTGPYKGIKIPGAINYVVLSATMVGRRKKFFTLNRLKRLEKLNICRRQVM